MLGLIFSVLGKPDLRKIRQTIRECFLDGLSEAIDPARVAWENRAFTPPTNDYWVQESVQIILENPAAMELWQILGKTNFAVFYPVGKGTEKIEELTQKISEAFEKYYSLNTQGIAVGIERIERSVNTQFDDHWWMGVVSIFWRAYAPAAFPFVAKVS